MLDLLDILTKLRENVSFYFLNMSLLIANVLVGFHTQYYSVMFCSLAAITACTYLYDANKATINMQLMDNIVIASILMPTAFLWFQHGHPMRVYAGFIILWALGLYIANKLIGVNAIVTYFTEGAVRVIPSINRPVSLFNTILAYLASFGHFVFNIEWAMLVLL